MTLVWECGAQAHCIVEHHQGFLYLFTDAAKEGQPVDNHYLLRSPVDPSQRLRKWEVKLSYVINMLLLRIYRHSLKHCFLFFLYDVALIY